MRIRRTIPPAAAPVSALDLLHGFRGIADSRCIPRLENEIKEYFGVRNVFFVSSGKAALYLILAGLKDLTAKRRVVVPAYTCFSVPSAVRMAGLEIVPCDVCPDTLDFDFEELERLLDDDTLCIVSTHLFGIPADLETARRIRGTRKIFLVEDAAQAMGAVSDRKKIGTRGDAAFFSFGRGKNITSGSGGMIVTSDDAIADSIREHVSRMRPAPLSEYLGNILGALFLAAFLHPRLYWFPKSLPFLGIGETRFHETFPVHPMAGFQAGLLFRWRRNLERFNRVRAASGDDYIKRLHLSRERPMYDDAIPYLRFPLYMPDKETKERVCAEGDRLGISPMYPSSIARIEELKGEFPDRSFVGSDRIADLLVTLPTHALLKEQDGKEISQLAMAHLGDSRHGMDTERETRRFAGWVRR